jgi:hypothetical protein
MTRKGYIRQVLSEALNGDIVAIFYGCEMPYLLRSTGESHYKLIKNYYVYGIMYDEALDFPRLLAENIRLV